MSLDQETVEELVAAMSVTRKGMRLAHREGGHFYFVGDMKGTECVLIVFNKRKDKEGKKTLRIGRSMVRTFRKNGVKPFYSQGIVEPGKPTFFSIEKGNARPATLKIAFKKCTMLHEGVGNALVGVLKGVKFQMASKKKEEVVEVTPEQVEEREEELESWRRDNAEMLAEIGGMSPEEVEELFEVEKDFEAYAQALSHTPAEDTHIQQRLAETEALLKKLNQDAGQMQKLKKTDITAALVLETKLQEQRGEMAQTIAVGGNPFDLERLADAEKEALNAMQTVGTQLLMDRMTALREENDRARAELESLSTEEYDRALQTFELKRSEMLVELETIQSQLLSLAPSY